jgi:hypothetical protein
VTAKQPSSQLASQFQSCSVPFLIFLLAFILYAATAAPATLFGDPSEYQFIPAVLGIAHPPGFAFYTLLAKLWQTLVPIGTIAFRTNLLAAAAGAWTVTAVYLTTRDIGTWYIGVWYVGKLADGGADQSTNLPITNLPTYQSITASLFAALSIAISPDLWQHAIHANAHIVSAALAITHLWLLVRWWRTGHDRWLTAFALTLGLAVTHHPITLMGVPAYGLFILAVRPRILRQWRTLLMLAGCLLLGLMPLLYYPLRSPNLPLGFEPGDMNTWEGFWRHTTAKGLRVNFFHFGLADQFDRALVFWSLLRLQFPLPVIALIAVGLFRLVRRSSKPALLVCLFLLVHLLFTLNFYQDIMAYLVIPFAALAIVAGIGALAAAELFWRLTDSRLRIADLNLQSAICNLLFIALLLLWPVLQGVQNLARGISLRDFTAAEAYVAAVYGRFAGRGEGAVLLSDWEHLTPLFVHIHAQGERLDEADVKKLVYVNPADGPTWVRNVWENIEVGPIYVVGYRPSLRDEGFRLLPDGPFYRVVAPPVTDAVPAHPLDAWADGRVHIVGYDLPAAAIHAGAPLKLVLYQSVTEPLEEIWMPYAQLGPLEARWMTDGRLLTPQWLPGEVVVEEYELPVPFGLPPGEYPLRLGYADLIGSRLELPLSTGGITVELATVTVLPNSDAPVRGVLEEALANLDNQVALMGARARAGWQARQAPWQEPLTVRAGQPLHLTLTWRALASPRDSFTVFIHLMDGTNRPVAGCDDTPLGGSFPTYLWFPKWLPGQTVDDPYRLVIPADLPPGDYLLEAGMYGMTSHRRLSVVDLAGNLAGDRVILGPIRVE